MTRTRTGRVIVGLLWLTILAVVAGGWSVHPPAPSGTAADSDAFGGAASPRRLDLYGNEIDDAVGDYRIDVRGDIYERHSPDTEFTQLAAPSL